MKQFILKHKKAITGTAAVLLIGAITMSFEDSPFRYGKFTVQEDYYAAETPCGKYVQHNDTLPEKNFTIKDFDRLQNELDKSMFQLSDEMKKIDVSKMQKDIEQSLKAVDMEKMMKDVERSLKSIDLEKMMASVNSSMKDVDIHMGNIEIEKALKEAKREIEKAKIEIKDIDRDAIKKELEKVKVEIGRIDTDKIMNEAKKGIDEAKVELKRTREMFDELEKDGLVNLKQGFELEYKDKSLYIDGVKQPEKVTGKYRKYFKEDHFKIKIDKE